MIIDQRIWPSEYNVTRVEHDYRSSVAQVQELGMLEETTNTKALFERVSKILSKEQLAILSQAWETRMRDKWEGFEIKGPIHVVHLSGGNFFLGQVQDGVIHGTGVLVIITDTQVDNEIWPPQIIEGQHFHHYLTSGKTVIHFANGSTYKGETLNGQAHGKGTFYSAREGITYEGQWHLDLRHGYGEQFLSDGTWYKGYWSYGKPDGLIRKAPGGQLLYM